MIQIKVFKESNHTVNMRQDNTPAAVNAWIQNAGDKIEVKDVHVTVVRVRNGEGNSQDFTQYTVVYNV